MRYTVVVVPDESGAGFVAYVPAIPGCVTQGDDLPEALAMARDAAAAMLASIAAHGEEIPTELPGAVVASVEVDAPARRGMAAAD
jgi:predicted RNase H-like HicB family nuclease